MSAELDAVLDRCVSLLTQDPAPTREEIAVLLNRWEELGLISRQMRAVIVQRVRSQQSGKLPAMHESDPAGSDREPS